MFTQLLVPLDGSPASELAPKVRRAAQVAQLAGDVEEFPRGFDTRRGERGVTLSGGQRQRTAIARALVREPAIPIFDDALSAVDTQTEARILVDLLEANSGNGPKLSNNKTLFHADHGNRAGSGPEGDSFRAFSWTAERHDQQRNCRAKSFMPSSGSDHSAVSARNSDSMGHASQSSATSVGCLIHRWDIGRRRRWAGNRR